MFDSNFGRSVEDKLWRAVRAHERAEEHRGEVLALVYTLETEKTITGDIVEAIIEGTIGPADGRPYHDPEFRQMLERYHEAVPRAHKQHAGVEVRIPVPVPPPPVDVAMLTGPDGRSHHPSIGSTPPSPPRPTTRSRPRRPGG